MEKEKDLMDNYDKVFNYLFLLQKEDGKIEADVMTFTKEMTKEEFQTGFEETQKKAGIVKGFEVVYMGYSFYKKEKDIIFSFGNKIDIEKGDIEHVREQESSIQKLVK